MKFLHLADLHLGKRVNGFDLLEDQRYILEQVLALCDEHDVEAVLLAGEFRASRAPHPVHFAFVGGLLAAALDECQQLFVPERSGQVSDVVIDLAGAAAGLLVFSLIRRAWRRRRRVKDESRTGL